MALASIRINFDGSAVARLLAQLDDAPLEVRDAFLGALEAGEQLFLLKGDDLLTRRTGEMVVRLEPTDRLLGLFPAIRAGN